MEQIIEYSAGDLTLTKVDNDIFWLKWQAGDHQLGFNLKELKKLKKLLKKVLKDEFE